LPLGWVYGIKKPEALKSMATIWKEHLVNRSAKDMPICTLHDQHGQILSARWAVESQYGNGIRHFWFLCDDCRDLNKPGNGILSPEACNNPDKVS
jgi:hypothetical protein